MGDWSALVVAFVSANRDWALWLALILGAGETLAFVSLLVPSTAILIGIGAVVATGALDFGRLWAGAAVGAVLGSTLSFWLGWRFGAQMLRVRPLDRHPALVERGRAMLLRHGAVAVMLGHFLTFLRPVVFLLAGASRMGWPVFMAANVVGAVIWAFVIPKSGEVGGDVIGWIWRRVSGG